MAYYLSVCRERGDKKDFLLVSEQKLDLKLPMIKAQIYFEAPPAKLEQEEIDIISYPISKKEVELLLNKALERETFGFRSQGLFADGKVDKKALFNIFGYPSKHDINELLEVLKIKHPEDDEYHTLKVIPDKEHILDNRHHIFWEQYLKLHTRETITMENWNKNELEEADVLYEHNLIKLFLHEHHNLALIEE